MKLTEKMKKNLAILGGAYRPRSQADDGSHWLGGSDDPPAFGAVWGAF